MDTKYWEQSALALFYGSLWDWRGIKVVDYEKKGQIYYQPPVEVGSLAWEIMIFHTFFVAEKYVFTVYFIFLQSYADNGKHIAFKSSFLEY